MTSTKTGAFSSSTVNVLTVSGDVVTRLSSDSGVTMRITETATIDASLSYE